MPPLIFEATCQGVPVPQSRPRVGAHGTYHLEAARAHRRRLSWVFSTVAGRPKAWAGPVAVHIWLAGPPTRSDLDNHAKMVLDALVDAGVLAGDSVRIVRRLVVDVVEGEPRTVVRIRDLSGVRLRSEN